MKRHQKKPRAIKKRGGNAIMATYMGDEPYHANGKVYHKGAVLRFKSIAHAARGLVMDEEDICEALYNEQT